MPAKANLDQSLYARNKTKATQALSSELSAIYHAGGENLDRNGSYGSCTTLRSKIAWLAGRGLITVEHQAELLAR